MAELLRKQLPDTTRGRIVSLLQGGALTSDDIARTVGLTRSAVRVQITAMERDGIVRRVGKRPGTTRPSLLFQLTPEVEQSLSKAYVPMLAQLVRVFAEVLPAQQMNSILRRTGKALAKELTRGKQPAGNLRARVAAASQMLNDQLGATTRVENGGRIVIRGFGCPLAALTATHRGVCLALESLVTEIVGTRVRECCERNERPRCCFEIESGHSRRST
jgi:predicted ArsR family transcriptional regulator